MKLTVRDISKLISQNETFMVECKLAKSELPANLWETYSAFANTEGGVILLGIAESDGKFTIEGVRNPTRLIKDIWNTVNNRELVSANILFDRMVYSVSCKGKDVIVIEVPRADRLERPIYIGGDPFKGTFRRNCDGDYRCPRETVKAFLRDQSEITADSAIVERVETSDLNAETVRRYRRIFKDGKTDHIWNDLPDDEFLKKIGAVARGEDGRMHPTVAGLVCFGDFVSIMTALPNFFLDYRERLDGNPRWTDRVCSSDATWSGNALDFFFRIHDKVTADVKIPFALKDGTFRINSTPIHDAIREIVINALVHADYHGRQGIVVEKQFRTVTVSNPGTMRISRTVAIEGGTSDPRNSRIFNIFSLINLGERSGMGLCNLHGLWKKAGFAQPIVKESYDPDRMTVMVSSGTAAELAQNLLKTSAEIGQMPTEPDKTRQNPTANADRNRQPPTKPIRPSTLRDHSASVQYVYNVLTEDPSMTIRGIASRLNLGKDAVHYSIGTLIKLNLIRRVGPKKGGHWEVIA